MYLAPLNYDRFFKKVFSDIEISKKFLEDALSVTISEIEMLPQRNRVTDAARSVDFDFRCKIEGHSVIIEMQQWFKTDIIQRFHLYHCLNTALQLEDLPTKIILTLEDSPKKTIKEEKNYALLKPVITIIWLVHDNLNETDDYLSFVPVSQSVLDFIRDHALWNRKNMSELQEERKRVLKKINNNAKGLLWMQENKEIFFFQKNIVKNKTNANYLHWFDFAEKTLNKENLQDDFTEYQEDKIFKEMIKRLKVSATDKEDLTYIDNYEMYQDKVQQFIDSISREAIIDKEIELEEERTQKEEALAKEKEALAKEKEALAKEKEERRQKELALAKEKETRVLSAKTLLEYNVPIEKIMQTTGLSREEIEEIKKKM